MIILASLLAVYLAAPVIAGRLELGKRRGPVLWPEWLHETLFIIGCESANGYKPRVGWEDAFLRRPFFYGFPERPYPKETRLKMVKVSEKHNYGGWSPLIKMAEESVSEKEANGQYSMFDKRRKIFIREAVDGRSDE